MRGFWTRPIQFPLKKSCAMRWVAATLFFAIAGFEGFYTIKPSKSEKTLLIVGCARSGTSYTANILQKSGLDIPHEKMGKDGAVSWYLASRPSYRKRRINLKKFQFEHVFHQTRDPLKTISSVYFSEDRHSWSYILKQIPEIKADDSHLVKCAKYWYYWNLKAESFAEWRYRVEDFEQIFDEFSSRIGKNLSFIDFQNEPKNRNSYGEHKVFSWSELKEALSDDLYEKIIEMSHRYGYDY